MGRFRIGCFALSDGQFPIDRHPGNNKPILRLHGPIARGGIGISDVNSIYTSQNPKLALSEKFNTWNSFQNDPPTTKTRSLGLSHGEGTSPLKLRKIVRVKMPNGSTHLRVQIGNVAQEVKSLHNGVAAIGALTALTAIGTVGYLFSKP